MYGKTYTEHSPTPVSWDEQCKWDKIQQQKLQVTVLRMKYFGYILTPNGIKEKNCRHTQYASAYQQGWTGNSTWYDYIHFKICFKHISSHDPYVTNVWQWHTFVWKETQVDAFIRVKDILTSSP